jgi:hypothetical protein
MAQSTATTSLMDFSTLKMGAIHSTEMSVHTRSTRHHIAKDSILHSHHYEDLNSYFIVRPHIYVVVEDDVLCAIEHFSGTITRHLAHRQHISHQTVVRVLHEELLYLFHILVLLSLCRWIVRFKERSQKGYCSWKQGLNLPQLNIAVGGSMLH